MEGYAPKWWTIRLPLKAAAISSPRKIVRRELDLASGPSEQGMTGQRRCDPWLGGENTFSIPGMRLNSAPSNCGRICGSRMTKMYDSEHRDTLSTPENAVKRIAYGGTFVHGSTIGEPRARHVASGDRVTRHDLKDISRSVPLCHSRPRSIPFRFSTSPTESTRLPDSSAVRTGSWSSGVPTPSCRTISIIYQDWPVTVGR
jgi:hypothetical protein